MKKKKGLICPLFFLLSFGVIEKLYISFFFPFRFSVFFFFFFK